VLFSANGMNITAGTNKNSHSEHQTNQLTTPGLLLFSLAGNGANLVPFPAV
jgi:hypothetical protein